MKHVFNPTSGTWPDCWSCGREESHPTHCTKSEEDVERKRMRETLRRMVD